MDYIDDYENQEKYYKLRPDELRKKIQEKLKELEIANKRLTIKKNDGNPAIKESLKIVEESFHSSSVGTGYVAARTLNPKLALAAAGLEGMSLATRALAKTYSYVNDYSDADVNQEENKITQIKKDIVNLHQALRGLKSKKGSSTKGNIAGNKIVDKEVGQVELKERAIATQKLDKTLKNLESTKKGAIEVEKKVNEASKNNIELEKAKTEAIIENTNATDSANESLNGTLTNTSLINENLLKMLDTNLEPLDEEFLKLDTSVGALETGLGEVDIKAIETSEKLGKLGEAISLTKEEGEQKIDDLDGKVEDSKEKNTEKLNSVGNKSEETGRKLENLGKKGAVPPEKTKWEEFFTGLDKSIGLSGEKFKSALSNGIETGLIAGMNGEGFRGFFKAIEEELKKAFQKAIVAKLTGNIMSGIGLAGGGGKPNNSIAAISSAAGNAGAGSSLGAAGSLGSSGSSGSLVSTGASSAGSAAGYTSFGTGLATGIAVYALGKFLGSLSKKRYVSPEELLMIEKEQYSIALKGEYGNLKSYFSNVYGKNPSNKLHPVKLWAYENQLAELSGTKQNISTVSKVMEGIQKSIAETNPEGASKIQKKIDEFKSSERIRKAGERLNIAFKGVGEDKDYKDFMVGFKSGGFTGWGNPNDVAGIVHKNEWVFNQDQMRSLGGSYNISVNINGGQFDSNTNIKKTAEKVADMIYSKLKKHVTVRF